MNVATKCLKHLQQYLHSEISYTFFFFLIRAAAVAYFRVKQY